jgi:hypothetical protein
VRETAKGWIVVARGAWSGSVRVSGCRVGVDVSEEKVGRNGSFDGFADLAAEPRNCLDSRTANRRRRPWTLAL